MQGLGVRLFDGSALLLFVGTELGSGILERRF